MYAMCVCMHNTLCMLCVYVCIICMYAMCASMHNTLCMLCVYVRMHNMYVCYVC